MSVLVLAWTCTSRTSNAPSWMVAAGTCGGLTQIVYDTGPRLTCSAAADAGASPCNSGLALLHMMSAWLLNRVLGAVPVHVLIQPWAACCLLM